MSLETNPPKVAGMQRMLTTAWREIEAAIKLAWRPERDAALGCGHYGCVFRTASPGVVCKVTTDRTEFDFVTFAMALPWPAGIVRYYAVMDLQQQYLRRPVFAVWREEANRVGEHDRNHYAYKEFQRYHGIYRHAAGYVRKHEDRLDRLPEAALITAWDTIEIDDGVPSNRIEAPLHIQRQRGADGKAPFERLGTPIARLAAAIRLSRISLEMMSQTAYGYTVGEALLHYLDHGMLLADVHLQNIGHVNRDGHELLVITDPGHAVLLPAKLVADSVWL